MPFLLSVEQAVEIIIRGLKTKKFEIHFPYKLTLFFKFIRLLPYCFFTPPP